MSDRGRRVERRAGIDALRNGAPRRPVKMCGIAGIVHFGQLPDASERVRRMANSIRHRGPDGEGFWCDRDIALGFRRLAIVDLEGGGQPMCNEDGHVWIVFNGEIYNHLALRRELEANGHRFVSNHSDTEVIVHGWEQWGERLPERLNGMFAFAVWDQHRRCLFLARDRHGIKPLYLATTANGAVAFGSEVRALHASGVVPLEADPAAILQYFSLMNLWHGRTPFQGVAMLPPGTCEVITPEHRRRHRYWDFTFPRNRRGDMASEAGAFREVLQAALRRQLAADVPVMTYLSGGIDSSAITAASYRLNAGVRAYSCIFDLNGVGDDRFVDEREFSRTVANDLSIERVELEVPQDALTRTLDATVYALEYPRMGMAYVNYLIAQRVAGDAKVVLSGMGGDEMTGGYVGRYGLVPRTVTGVAPAVGADPFSVYRTVLNVPIPEHERARAFTPEFLAAAGEFSPMELIGDTIASAPSDDPWDVLMYVDATTYLHGLLVLEDKLSMIHSLETRVPLLDNEVVDHLLGVPWSLLSDGVTGKILFREAVRPWVSEAIYTKPKMGFGPPDASWYRGRLRGWVADRLGSLAERGVLRPDYIRGKFAQHQSGEANWVALIWCLLSFESWCRQTGAFGGTTVRPGRDWRELANPA
jgi:asparagine synthase (glutamine-hydrolysing)